MIQDETPDQPTDETPTPDEENVEPTTAPDEPPAPEETPAEDAPAEDAPAEDEDPGSVPDETLSQADETPAAEAEETPAPEAEETPAAEADEAPGPEAEEAPAAEPAAEAPAADAPEAEAEDRRPPKKETKAAEPEVIPGAHLEPDLVLDQPSADGEGDEYSQYAVADEGDDDADAGTAPEAPAVRSPLELAADARYQATGKRKTAIARVILKPGSGVYTINGKTLEVYFPRERLQTQARQPLDATGNLSRMDVDARIHGGGVSAQAAALRHGIARALVEAEPTLRTELKRRGYLTRDPREKERKKAGLKKARKRPQFSKR
ncbi:MAG: small subunit ribosomal protein [Thermoleophilaceae bacterium]|nr:small subunit ribosomal protein [Thermoleophilaceae bacterium]